MKLNKAWEYREKILFADNAGEFINAAQKALDEINDASVAASASKTPSSHQPLAYSEHQPSGVSANSLNRKNE